MQVSSDAMIIYKVVDFHVFEKYDKLWLLEKVCSLRMIYVFIDESFAL